MKNDSRLSRQPGLFDAPPRPVSPAPPPNLERIRMHLAAQLRMARRAVIMPWHQPDADHWERFFPELARLLPQEEGEALIAAFAAEIARLKQVVHP